MGKIIISIIGLLAAGALFFMYTKPSYDNTQQLRDQIASYNQALDKAAELQQLKQQLLSRYNAFNPMDLDRIHKLLPDHVDNVRLILDMDSMASQYGMAIANVDISGNSAAAPTSITTVGTLGPSSQKYDSLKLSFSTSGTYTDFRNFLADLESSLRIVTLEALSLSPAGAVQVPHGSNIPEPVFNYAISLRTYWLK